MLLFELSRPRPGSRRAMLLAVLAVVTIGLVFVYTDVSWAEVIASIQRLSPWALLPLMALLPIAGFSVAIVYLIAGARFGPVWGGVVVLGVTFVHLVGTYAVARTFLRGPLQRFMEKRQGRLPEVPPEDQPAVCVIAALVPGLPYAVRNYLVVLAGVKLRVLLAVGLPIHVARSYVIILLGDTAHDPARARVAILLGIDLLRAMICALVIWRLRVRQRARQRASIPAG
ncbi:MAG: hypothetical protein JNL92_05325 [Opitutaceae bacterium]|nr:hypothetical protein [Opitutaceae bacterium]